MSKTRKRVLGYMVIVLMAFLLFQMIPKVVNDSIPSIYYVMPSVTTYESVVQCAGTLETAQKQQIILESSIMPNKINVSVGDTVNSGDVLAEYDQVNMVGISASIPQIGFDEKSIENMMSSYGISEIISSVGLSPADLAGYITQTAKSNTAEIIKAGDESGIIRATISGVITSVSLDANTLYMAGSSAFTIINTDSYIVNASVSESDISRINVGDNAKIRGTAFAGRVYTGVVSKIYPTARKSLNGTSTETVVDIEVSLDNPDNHIKPGFSAKVEITGENKYNIICVPYEAIRQDENNNEYVYVYEDGKLKKSHIITGQELTSVVEVLDGITAESIVIYNPDDVSGEGAVIHLKGHANVD